MERPMQKLNDLSRSPSPLDPDGTLIAVIELSLSNWLVAGIVRWRLSVAAYKYCNCLAERPDKSQNSRLGISF
jgi:hypothetical protein